MTLDEALAELRARATEHTRQGLKRYAIPIDRAWGVSVLDIRAIARIAKKDHALAQQLWATGVYDARLLAAFVARAERLTPGEMDAWMHDCDNWGLVDTLCCSLFDKSPHAFGAIERWAQSDHEFVKRGAFVLIAAMAVHQKVPGDAAWLLFLPTIKRAAPDKRNFVKKGVSWALRSIGHRNVTLHQAALSLAHELVRTGECGAWVGRDVLRDLQRPMIAERAARRSQKATQATQA